MAPPSSGKRKDAPMQTSQGRNFKRNKIHDARVIRTQTADAAFSNGELNVDKFVKAREFEIKALEDGIKRSKHGLSTRAHQELPRELRRRTASHNVKRVPKRLRERAKKEMIEDNTPTVTSRRRKPSGHQRLRLETAQRLQALSKKIKARRQRKKALEAGSEMNVIPDSTSAVVIPKNAAKQDVNMKKPRVKRSKLREPALPPARFRKRQIYKAWLPTHLWHSKRARMTPPKEPMWRFALPLTPHIKSYRNAHRASGDKGAIAWDTSYMATISLEGTEQSVSGLLKALGIGQTHQPYDPWGPSGVKWRMGTRILEGCVYQRDSPAIFIAPVTIIWAPYLTAVGSSSQAQTTKARRKAFIRVHPSAFFQLWEETTRLAKIQKPSITVEDLRFEIGSIEITGPDASEALVGTLRPLGAVGESATAEMWSKIATTPPASLPSNALLFMGIGDPRLRHPPRTLSKCEIDPQHSYVMQLLASWPIDQSSYHATIFDRNTRLKASRSLGPQKAINRRKAQCEPGEYPIPLPTDPLIPVLVFATRNGSEGTGTWTVMLPWKCVSPVWNSLVYYPLSTGGTIRFGGINEMRQLAYEQSTPWFPADFPATQAGQQWNNEESNRRKTEWDRKPKSRRLEYESLDLGGGRKGEIGNGWTCDWHRLVQDSPVMEEGAVMDNVEHSERVQSTTQVVRPLHHLQSTTAFRSIASGTSIILPQNALASVKVNMVGRGRPSNAARIYRLPSNNQDLRQKWLAQQPTTHAARSNSRKARLPPKPSPEASSAVHRSWLAATILTEAPEPGNKDFPAVPDEADLIGFVTTGNFSLKEGKGVGIGSLLMNRVIQREEDWIINGKGEQVLKHEFFLCILRDAGEPYGRLATWKFL